MDKAQKIIVGVTALGIGIVTGYSVFSQHKRDKKYIEYMDNNIEAERSRLKKYEDNMDSIIKKATENCD